MSPRPGLGKRLIFALGAAVMVLAALELGLRLTGWLGSERPGSVLAFQQHGPFDALPVAGGLVLPSGSPRAVAKPKTARRVALLGGSAALGSGYTPLVAMSGQVERALRSVSPSQPVEVIDMGIGGAASSQVLQVLRSLLAQGSPDLVLVYSGNNEMLEALAITAMPEAGQRTQRLRRGLWSLHLFRLLSRAVPDQDPEQGGHAPGGALHEAELVLDEADRAAARALYRRNLQAMAREAREVGVPLVLSTVAVNLRDYRDPGGSHEEQALFGEAHARLADGRLDEAREAFEAAVEQAARPSRADRQLRQILREVAAEQGVTLCDVAAELAERAQYGIPGQDLFFDSCHANQQGHEIIGLSMARCALLALGEDPSALRGVEPGSLTGGDAWRIDDFTGRWDLQLPPDSGGAQDAATAGHLAFARQQPAQARDAYLLALERGAPRGAMEMNLGIVALYQGDLQAARSHLDQAAQLLADDPVPGLIRATLGR